MSHSRKVSGLLVAALLCVAAVASADEASERAERDACCAAITSAIRSEISGLTKRRVHVEHRDGTYWIEVDGTSAQQQAAATIRDRVVSERDPRAEPETVEDALVVLRFEPGNNAALAIVEARYAELRQSARAKRGR